MVSPEKHIERMNAYSTPTDNGVRVEIEEMLVDLIMFFKVGGYTASDFHQIAAETWDQVEVEITIPSDQKN